MSIGNLATDNVTIRFEVLRPIIPLIGIASPDHEQTNNAGPWLLHCHIDFHLNAGFAVVMAEDMQQTAVDNPVPCEMSLISSLPRDSQTSLASWEDLCPTYDAGTSS